MSESKRNTPPFSAKGIGQTDLARMDAHVIQPEEYAELPEITDEMIARGVPGNGLDLARRGRGRPRIENPKRQVTLRVDGDVIEAMRATGPGWQARANEALRERFKA
ncbi:BrnA antitoxin family protein [Methylobacterium sp. E-045]|uniref:BrnA antitoxin family protein n=1 Tax=Methylobacterium sp. E-045 TaxID=2836575 RepID=UPI001FBB26BF|nr:BrnA antitoxin family protein [Methylobacterium sp. E-045]MCJ2131331.1 BrnA antitoxin family protein [Methylobacterium sp. E-045]